MSLIFPTLSPSGKLSQLRNLTKLLCEPETFNSIEEMCQLSSVDFGKLCEESALHVQLLEAAELGTEIATSLLYHDSVLSEKLRDLLSGEPSKINLDMDWWVFFIVFFLGKISSQIITDIPSSISLPLLLCCRFLEQALQMNYLENITRLTPTIEAMLHVNNSADTFEKPGVSPSIF